MTTDANSSLRRSIVAVTIGSFSIAALMGVVALLGGGSFGEGEGKVLLTTLIVGSASVAVLCYLATADTRFQAVGVLGGVVVLVPLTTALWMVWAEFDDVSEPLWKTFGVGLVLAATLAQASLLLALAGRVPSLRWLLVVTLGCAAVLAAIVSVLIVAEVGDTDSMARVIGILAILDVLGTVVCIALGVFGRIRQPAVEQIVLPADLRARLSARAAETGRSTNDLLVEAAERYLA
ncbi:conserved membrane hypothetical protein [metagenome]|uniref:Uncharacterized protein n=1 Tax=metagenome TaxID=256318 RepID=A0A2P2CGZ7_9ZZZZ